MSYDLVSERDIPDYNGVGRQYVHKKSGAQVFHLHNDDPENLFAFAFRTLPPDSTGVAHILEHSVLCGSKRFPVKDPFLLLLKGSAHTFLNAMTYPDRTVYPAASPVRQDLFNLMKVYGDATFFPLLKPEMFRQEGHRLQFKDDGSLEIGGIVYNEMKGNYSSHDSIAGEYCLRSLFPDTVYQYDSGGDPKEIPALTYDEFKAFHEHFYHPSNARIVLYGNIPTEDYLEFLDREFLSHFDRRDIPETVPLQERWSEPRRIETTYPAEDGNGELTERTSVTMNWLLDPVTDTDQLLVSSVMADILVGHSGSPLEKALVESPLGQDLSPVLGLEADIRETVFSAGLRGTDPDKVDQIESLIMETLQRVAADGIDPELLEGSLRRVEFQTRELKSGPNGLRVMSRALRRWNYDGDPADGLLLSQRIEALRKRLEKEPKLFETAIRERLIENPHRTTVVVKPDGQQAEREAHEIRELLEAQRSQLDKTQAATIRSQQEELEKIQTEPDPPEDLAKIPYLTLKDIPREILKIPFEETTLPGGIEAVEHPQNTNGIVYVDMAFDISALPEELIPYLNLYTSAFSEVGLPGMTYDEFARKVALNTGGISSRVSVQPRTDDTKQIERLFFVRTKMLAGALDDGLGLVETLLTTLDFGDTQRLEQVLQETRNDLEAHIIPAGHYFASLRAAAAVSPLSALEERVNGYSQLELLRGIKSADQLVDVFRWITNRVLDTGALKVNITADAETIPAVRERLAQLISSVASHRQTPTTNHPTVDAVRFHRATREFLHASAMVNYVGQAMPGALLFDDHYAGQEVLAQYLRTGALWELIRMKGGAYGAMAGSRTAEQLFTFASYRDPHSVQTLEAYRTALEQVASKAPERNAVELNLISMLGRELRPLVPREQGFVNFKRRLHGTTDDLRQRIRDNLFAVKPRAVQKAAKQLLSSWESRSIAILGGQTALDAVRQELGEHNWSVTELHI